MFLRRPCGTPQLVDATHFPTLKRGANKLCAYGAAALLQFAPERNGASTADSSAHSSLEGSTAFEALKE
jgi:hypothetical protein